MYKAFNELINEGKEGKNVHLNHIEDSPFLDGINGIRDSIYFLQSLRDMLASKTPKRPVTVTTKWDGCLSGDSQIVTNEGVKTLKEIYDSWHSNKELWVFAYDEITKKDCFVPIVNTNGSKSKKNWLRVDLESTSIICTEDHEIFTENRGWVKAIDLTIEDNVKTIENINMDGDQLYFQIGDKYVQINNIADPL